jgi:hypothetical protein
MNAQPQTPRSILVQELNESAIALHLLSLGLPPTPGATEPGPDLVALDLMERWAANYAANGLEAEVELGAAVSAAAQDPVAVHNNLTDDRMLEATSLEQAAALLATRLNEILGSR